jgi:Protein of unknown function (DUF1997)
MQANSAEQKTEIAELMPQLGVTSGLVESAIFTEAVEGQAEMHHEPMSFHGHFSSCMELFASSVQVSTYLDNHRDWFPRCAQPMETHEISANGYALRIGKFGSFGYEVEAKIGLDLLPQDGNVYRIETIPIPGYEPPGYEVDFQAAMNLVEIGADSPMFPKALIKAREKAIALRQADEKSDEIPERVTRVEWVLDLQVQVQFPRFIYALPKQMVQTTGDRLLNQIVRQVSRRLTHKVQEDFQVTMGVTFPRKRKFGHWK